jgi:hypothetical protein
MPNSPALLAVVPTNKLHTRPEVMARLAQASDTVKRMSLFRPVQVDDTDRKDAIARVKRVAGGRARARAEAIIHA